MPDDELLGAAGLTPAATVAVLHAERFDAETVAEFADDLDPGARLVFWGANVAMVERTTEDSILDAQGVPAYYVERLCPVLITFSSQPDGEAVEFRDRMGFPLTAELTTANLRLRTTRLPWTGSPTIEARVPEGAASYAVFRGASEVRFVPVVLDPDRKTEIVAE